MMRMLISGALILTCLSGFAQDNFPVNGVRDKRVGLYAFTNAVIYKDYNSKLENATLLVKDGRVAAIGPNVSIPQGTVTRDMGGKIIYPSFIDIYSDYGLPEVNKKSYNFFAPPQLETKKDGAYSWNQTIRPETDAVEHFEVNEKEAAKWREIGFGTMLSHVKDGIARGSSVLVTLNDDSEHGVIVRDRASANYSFDRGSSTQLYPNSIMGSVALIRQALYDNRWYHSSADREHNESLEAMNGLLGLPQIFDASHRLNLFLVDDISREFGMNFIIKGGGDEYQRLSEVKNTGARLIVPIDYPEAFDTSDPLMALDIDYNDLKHWEMADYNPGILESQQIEFALTAEGVNPNQFWKNLRRAVKHGLTETGALKALTHTPASMLNVSNDVGSLREGSIANFFVTDENIFSDGVKIQETWIDGKRYVIQPDTHSDYSGKYDLRFGNNSYELEIKKYGNTHKVTLIENDSTKIKVKSELSSSSVSLTFNKPGEKNQVVRLTGWSVNKDFKGKGRDEQGNWIDWQANFKEEVKPAVRKESKGDSLNVKGDLIYPFVAFGRTKQPQAKDYLIKNATVWTNESQGIMESADVSVSNGKIKAVGKNLEANGAVVIDGTGKHLTSGIIDEHSHAGLRGVNESSHSITAEVRMYDAIDSEDIDIYRQLAGGVTAAQLLHGSANAIGGQSALIKFRWGATPDGLKIDNADGYIKFALGENVKQSNRPRSHNVRYPQTRMGVEQVFVDAFTRAKEYEKEWNTYRSLPAKNRSSVPAPRRDLQLDALLEILNKERFISCHSYVQSEINMLMKVAERFDFHVNTFTHILEGYKVADKMFEHGAGGSTFSDWWAYKWEVKEAIPYNPALMNMVGVVTAINSDDGEMARRLNQEAAKSVKYAGMSEEEVWKMVTLNPAKLLHLDDRMGSVKVGKDADLVLWNENPLSIYARAEKAMIDGAIYFDLEEDENMRAQIAQDRARIISKMESVDSAQKRKPNGRGNKNFHCEDEFISNNYSSYK